MKRLSFDKSIQKRRDSSSEKEMCVCVTWRREDCPPIDLWLRGVKERCSIKSVNECVRNIDVHRMNFAMNGNTR